MDQRSLTNELNESLRTQKDLTDRILNKQVQTVDILKRINALNMLNNKYQDDVVMSQRVSNQLLAQQAKLQSKLNILDVTDEINSLIHDTSQLEQSNLNIIRNANIELDSRAQIQAIQNKLQNGEIDKAKILIRIQQLQNEQVRSIADGTIQRLNYDRELLSIHEQFPDLSSNDLTNIRSQLQTLQRVNESQTEILSNGQTRAQNLSEQNRILEQQRETLNSSLETVRNTFNTFRAIASDPRIATGLFMASIANHSVRFLTNVENTRKELGLSISDGLELGSSISSAAISGAMLGVSLEESTNAAKAIVNETNNLTLATSENIKQIALLESRYGVTAETGAKLQDIFRQINNNSSEIANKQLDSFVTLSKTSGLPIGKLMSEVASDTEFFAKFAKDGGANIRDAAASALKLGVGMSTVSSISDNLLNIESSIESEMNASVLLGKELNLNKAREFALLGDQKGMMDEIVNNLGNINQWEKMNVIQRQAFSEAVGVSVADMQTMIANQTEMNRLSKTQTSIWDDFGESVIGIGKGIMNYKDVALTSLNALASMKHITPGLFDSLGKRLGKFGKIFTSVSGTAQQTSGSGLSSFFSGWKKINSKDMLKFSLGVGILIATLPLLAFGLKQFTDVPWDAALVGMTSLLSMTLIMKLIGNQSTNILKGSIALGLLSAALIPLGYGLNQFSNIDLGSLAKAGVAIGVFTAAVFGLGALLSSGTGTALFGAGLVGFVALSGVMTALGLSLQIVSGAMSTIIPLFSQLVPLTTQLASIAPEMIAIGAGFTAMGIGLMTLATGAALLTPFLPILEKLNVGNVETKTSESTNNDKLMAKLDTLIDLMIKGGEIKLNDRKLGQWVGARLETIKTYNQ